jgi:CxxC motif-containing protein (DUF1111 family)
MFLRLSIPPETDEHKKLLAERRINVIPEPTYGAQLQNHSVQGVPIEGHMRIDYTDKPVTLGDGTTVTLREPKYSVTDLGYGPLHPKTMLSPRVAPQMIGLGLLEAIPEADIRAAADPDDKNGDGISGRVNDVWSFEHNKPMLGRFGWKAGNATVAQQSAEAFSGDIGISNPMFPAGSGECTPAQKVCIDAPHGDSPRQDGHEIGRELFDLVVFYSQNLAVPPRRRPEDPVTLAGKSLFQSVGCASCHTPTHTTGSVPGQPHLSNQKIWPYTDLPCRQPPRRRRRRTRVAHAAALGYRTDGRRQSQHELPPRWPRPYHRGSNPLARRRSAKGPRCLCQTIPRRARRAPRLRKIALDIRLFRLPISNTRRLFSAPLRPLRRDSLRIHEFLRTVYNASKLDNLTESWRAHE